MGLGFRAHWGNIRIISGLYRHYGKEKGSY